MRLRKQAWIGILGLAFLLTINGSAFAKNSGHVNLGEAVNINGTKLAAGEYYVSWQTHSPEATVTFKGKHGAQGTVEGVVVDRPTRYHDDSVVYANNPDGSKTILEIRFAGSKQVLTFGEAAATSEVTMPKVQQDQGAKVSGSGPQARQVKMPDARLRDSAIDPYLVEAIRHSQRSQSPANGRQPISQ